MTEQTNEARTNAPIENGSSPLHEVFGMNLPVIAELPNGYRLVAHPNGPGVADNHSLYALELMAGDAPATDLFEKHEEDESDELPFRVRAAAIEKYRRWSWPFVRGQFTYPGASNESFSGNLGRDPQGR